MVCAVSTRAFAQDDDLVVPSTPSAAGAGSPSPSGGPQKLLASKPAPPGGALPSPSPDTQAAAAAAAAEIEELRNEVHSLRDEVKDVKDQQASHPFLEIWDDSKAIKSQITPWDIPGRDGIWVTGFIQSQYETTQNS